MTTLIVYQRQPIAHEIVFPEHSEKTIPNCIKFVVQNYLYLQDMKVSEFAKAIKLHQSIAYREFCVHTHSYFKTNENRLDQFCNYFNLNKFKIFEIALAFSKTNHNVLILNSNLTKVKFYYGYKQSFSEAA